MNIQPVAALSETIVQQFKGTLRVELIRPGDEAYDVARKLHNAMVDRRPGLIVRCAGVADVMSAVETTCRSPKPEAGRLLNIIANASRETIA